MTVELTMSFSFDCWLEPETKEAVVIMNGKELIRRKLDDLTFERKKRAGWRIEHGRRDECRPGGGAGGPPRRP